MNEITANPVVIGPDVQNAEQWAQQQAAALGYYVSPSSAPPELSQATVNAAPTVIGPDPAKGPPVDPRAVAYWGGEQAARDAATPPGAPAPAAAAPLDMSPDAMAARSVAAMNAPSPPPPAAPAAPTSIASLREGSARMNAELQGAPQATPSKEAKDAAAALAYYGGGSKPSGKGGTGGGGGVPRGPSDYSKGMAGMRGTYDKDKVATQEEADAEKARANAIAVGSAAVAQQKLDDQALQQMEAQNAAMRFADYSAETQRQIDDVRAKKIEPNRQYADTGSAIMAIIGATLGGMYQGLNKLEKNPFIEQMNKNIDRDIAVQESNLRTQKEGIGERRHLLAEMRATYKDENVAKLQARNLYYEGAKEAIAAQAAGFESPVIQARADHAINALSREQSKLDIQEALRKAAMAAAAAAAAEARRQKDFENRLKMDEHQRKWFEAEGTYEKGQREKGGGDVARFVGTGKDADGNPTGYLERNAEGAKERENARIGTASLITKIDSALEIRAGEGAIGRTINRSNPDQPIQLYTPEWQTKIRGLKAEMLTDWAHAKKLGVLSTSDRELGDAAIGDLESRGDKGDVSLRQLKSLMQKALDAEANEAAGARATKIVENGRERIVMHGTSNAPTNRREVPRTPVK